MKSHNNKNEFLYKWFELYHVSLEWPAYEFATDLLFSDNYLLKILSIGIPNDFETIEDDDLSGIPNAQALSH